MEAAEFSQVLTLTAKAIAAGGLTSLQLQECYRFEGEALVAVGKASEARGVFAKLLILNPDAQLGEFVSPKITEELEAARAELGGQQLQASAEALASGGVSIRVEADPQSMSSEAEMVYEGSGGAVAQVRSKLTNGSATFDVPTGASETIEVRILDGSGNALASYRVARKEPIKAVTKLSAGPKAPQSSQPVWSRWWVWAAGSATMGVIGGGFGVASQQAQDDLDEVLQSPGDHFFADASKLEDKARSRATFANISFVAAGGLAAASAYFYFRGRSTESAATIIPSVDASGTSSLQLVGMF